MTWGLFGGLLGALLTASLAQIFFQDVLVLLFDPPGVDFELPTGPPLILLNVHFANKYSLDEARL